jgi:Flp pilus assembly protein TadG
MMLPHPIRRARRYLANRPGRPNQATTSKSRGQSMVEFALILPIFALFLVIAVDFGRVFFSYIQITNAAREGAAYAAVQPAVDADIETYALQEINVQGQQGESAIGITTTCADQAGDPIACSAATGGTGPGNTITVVAEEDFSFLTPLVNNFFGSFTIRTSATAAVLGYVASGGVGGPPPACVLPAASFTVVTDDTLVIYANPAASTPNSPGDPCNISGYNWTWGDGEDAVGDATGVTHTYSSAGTYTVTLEVTNQAGPSSTSTSVTVPDVPGPPTCAPPVANFSWTNAGKTYTYTDTSTVSDPVNCPITDWLWTFHSTSPSSQSNAQNPAVVTYPNNSSHTVTLQVTNAGGTRSITRSD